MEYYLIRHTQPKIERGICYGQTDLPVAESFNDDLSRVKGKLPNGFDAVYSSPLQRCSILAEHLFPASGIVYSERLMELKFGDWEMQSWSDLPQGKVEEWASDYVHVAPPDGENFKAVYDRVIKVWESIMGLECEKVAIIAHAGPIRCLLAHCLSMPLEHSFKISLDYGSVSRIQVEGSRTTVRIND